MPAPLKRMTAMDATFLYLERMGQLMHVASIAIFDGPLSYERLVADIAGRLHLIPRYKQRAVTVPLGIGHPSWEPDPQFDVRHHVIHHRLRGAGDDRQLSELASRLFGEPLDRRRPLWEVHLIDNYQGNRSALVSKVHHCMIDGVSGVQLMGVLFDPSPDPAPPPPPTEADLRPPPPLPSPSERVVRALRENIATRVAAVGTVLGALRDPSAALKAVTEVVESAQEIWRYLLMPIPPTPWNGHVSVLRRWVWATFPLHEVKAIKNRLGGTVNDVALATISGALRRYLEAQGENPDRVELRAACPVNTRTSSEHLKLGNRVSAMMAPLPVGIYDPAERYRQLRTAMAQLKARGESTHFGRMLDLMDLLPPILQRQVAWIQTQATPINTICTNVPGPPVSLYMQGKRIETFVPALPLTQGIGLAFAIMSYADSLTIGMPVDPGLVPDCDILPGLLEHAYAELRELAGIERLPPRVAPLPAERQRRQAATSSQVA